MIKDIDDINTKIKNHVPNKELIESQKYKNWVETRSRVRFSPAYYNARFNNKNPRYKIALKPVDTVNMAEEAETAKVKFFDRCCSECDAYLTKHDRPSMCCSKGEVKIPEVEYPEELMKIVSGTGKLTKVYHQHSRTINNSFNFTSWKMEEVPMADAKPSIKICGQSYMRLGPLELAESTDPDKPKRPRNAQLYILDNDTALELRKEFVTDVKIKQQWDILHSLLHDIINTGNVFAKAFKLGYERIKDHDKYKIVLGENKTADKTYNLPVVNEIAAIYNERDIQKHGNQVVVQAKQGSKWQIIKVTDEKYEPLGYPLLFLKGERRFAPKKYENKTTGKYATLIDYLKYILMVRRGKKNYLLCQGGLLLQYVLDMYIRVETNNFAYLILNNEKIQKRRDMLKNIQNSEDKKLEELGKKVVMTSSVTFTPNWFRVRFEKCLALQTNFGKPSLFLTATCNRGWEEVKEICDHEYVDSESHKYRIDAISRVFNDKK